MKRIWTAAGALVAVLLVGASGTSWAQTIGPLSIGHAEDTIAVTLLNSTPSPVCANLYYLDSTGTVTFCASCLMLAGQSDDLDFSLGAPTTLAVITSSAFGTSCLGADSSLLSPVTPGIEVIGEQAEDLNENFPSQTLSTGEKNLLVSGCHSAEPSDCPFLVL